LPVGDIGIVRRGLDAFRAGDIDALLALSAPEIVVHASPASDGAVHTGHTGLMEVIDKLRERWHDFKLEPLEFYEGEDCVLVLGTVVTKGRDEPGFASVAGWVWKLRDGLIVSVEAFLDADQAMHAAGLKTLPT
jgi:ketosteroid isomerase-like protein